MVMDFQGRLRSGISGKQRLQLGSPHPHGRELSQDEKGSRRQQRRAGEKQAAAHDSGLQPGGPLIPS